LEWFSAIAAGECGLQERDLYRLFYADAGAHHGRHHRKVPSVVRPVPGGQPAISKLDLLTKIRDAMKLNIEIEPYDDPPCDRSLSAARFLAATGYPVPAWTT